MVNVEQAANLASLGKQALIDLLNNLTQAKDFVLAQAPDVCQQYVALGRFECAAAFIAALLLALFAWKYPGYVIKKYYAHKEKGGDYDNDALTALYFFMGAIPTILSIIFTIILATQAWSEVAAWVAPKVYLIRAISEMVK